MGARKRGPGAECGLRRRNPRISFPTRTSWRTKILVTSQSSHAVEQYINFGTHHRQRLGRSLGIALGQIWRSSFRSWGSSCREWCSIQSATAASKIRSMTMQRPLPRLLCQTPKDQGSVLYAVAVVCKFSLSALSAICLGQRDCLS